MRAWLTIFWTFAKIGFQNESAYRANFWVEIVESLVNVGSALGSVQVVFARTDTLAGWTPPELVTLLGVYFTVYGLIHVVISPSLTRFMDDVRQGNLDFTLTKPADAQLLVSASEVRVWKLVDLALGLGILAWGLSGLATHVSPLGAAGFALALVAGVARTGVVAWLSAGELAFGVIGGLTGGRSSGAHAIAASDPAVKTVRHVVIAKRHIRRPPWSRLQARPSPSAVPA